MICYMQITSFGSYGILYKLNGSVLWMVLNKTVFLNPMLIRVYTLYSMMKAVRSTNQVHFWEKNYWGVVPPNRGESGECRILGWGMGGVPFPRRLGGLGSVVNSPQNPGGTLAGNAFWRPQNATFCTYMPILWVRQTVFYVTFAWGARPRFGAVAPPNVEPRLQVERLNEN